MQVPEGGKPKGEITRQDPNAGRVLLAPTQLVNKDIAKRPVKMPRISELELFHVFGYRGFDCRDNAHIFEDSNEIIYHAGAVCIILNVGTGN